MSGDTAGKLKNFVAEKYQPMLIPTEKLAGAMFVEPREHGKTVRWSFAYVLWRVLTGRAKYVLLIGASGDSARENLINIKTELEDNELIIEDFGLRPFLRNTAMSRCQMKSGLFAGNGLKNTGIQSFRSGANSGSTWGLTQRPGPMTELPCVPLPST